MSSSDLDNIHQLFLQLAADHSSNFHPKVSPIKSPLAPPSYQSAIMTIEQLPIVSKQLAGTTDDQAECLKAAYASAAVKYLQTNELAANVLGEMAANKAKHGLRYGPDVEKTLIYIDNMIISSKNK